VTSRTNFSDYVMLRPQLRNFNSLSGISFLAAVMSLGYSTIATGLTIHNGKQPGTVYNVDQFSTADAVLSGFNSLGIIAFAYGSWFNYIVVPIYI